MVGEVLACTLFQRQVKLVKGMTLEIPSDLIATCRLQKSDAASGECCFEINHRHAAS